MSAHQCARGPVHTVTTGLMFVITGVVLLGVMRGWWAVEEYWQYWPLVFVLPAVSRLAAGQLFAGLAWLAFVALLLAHTFGVLEWTPRLIGPLVLIVGGSRLLYLAVTRDRIAR